MRERRGVQPTPTDQPPDKLYLQKGMPPLTSAGMRRHANMVQGSPSGLEARVIAAVCRIIVAALSELVLRPQRLSSALVS